MLREVVPQLLLCTFSRCMGLGVLLVMSEGHVLFHGFERVKIDTTNGACYSSSTGLDFTQSGLKTHCGSA